MTTALTRLAGSAFELTITLPWADVQRIYDQVFNELAAQIEIEGFRKGTAPRHLVEPKLDKNQIYQQVINRLVPEAYAKALEEHGLKPVIGPKIQLAAAQENKDWQLIAQSAEKPTVNLDDYKKHVAEINAKNKIWTPASHSASLGKPGKDEEEKGKSAQGEKEEENKRISEIIDKLLQVCQVELAAIIVEAEASRLITQLIEDIRSAGLTYEQYLQSSSQTAQSVKEKYHRQAENALKLEFILEAIADDLNVAVQQEEIDNIVNRETDDEKKKTLKDQSYVLASILRRDKTLAKILAL